MLWLEGLQRSLEVQPPWQGQHTLAELHMLWELLLVEDKTAPVVEDKMVRLVQRKLSWAQVVEDKKLQLAQHR